METKQLSLDDWGREDVALGRRKRDEGIARAQRSAGANWQWDAVEAIHKVALRKKELTTDDVWAELGRDPEIEGRAMGSAMRNGAKLGLLRKTDRMVKSRRVACHRRDLRIWESQIFREPPNA